MDLSEIPIDVIEMAIRLKQVGDKNNATILQEVNSLS
jgi:hypothetical protein